VTLAEFRVRFPEFKPTDDDMVTAQLAAAELFVSDSWDADERDEIVALRAASLIATTMLGRSIGTAGQSITKDNAYANRLKKLLEIHACCYFRNG
jgi:hypothetical protein